MVKFQLPPALAHAAHRVCATCPQKLRPCAPRPPLCALAPTLRRGAGRSSSTRFRAGCALEGQQLPWLLMRSQVDCAALPDPHRAMWPLRPCLRPWPCPSRSSELSDSERQSDRHSRIRRDVRACPDRRSEEHTSELQSLMLISYAVFCLKKKKKQNKKEITYKCKPTQKQAIQKYKSTRDTNENN